MYFSNEQHYQSVDYNTHLGNLCVIQSLKGKTTVYTFQLCKRFQSKTVHKMVDIVSQNIFPNQFRIPR